MAIMRKKIGAKGSKYGNNERKNWGKRFAKKVSPFKVCAKFYLCIDYMVTLIPNGNGKSMKAS